ncbi:CDC27 family protein [Campylobacter armoricus]|uniref:Transformation system protein CtsX n=1 Tax=Campylobacter armoricus TaxID=2505970 RepID=A0A7L5I974_9BACT|nr:CDC27 family protein [Campylobacter armoricus]QKF79323.1 transformation system protein CtsX [Campylobacter armoricus]
MKMVCFKILLSLFTFSFVWGIEVKNDIYDTTFFYERFITQPNYENALNLAKYFYQIKSYENAIYWAIEANEFDLKQKEAWLIFINAKIKQGKYEQALKAKDEYEKLLENYFE